MRANRPKVWSISRRTLMNQCPRAWILKYGFTKNRGTFNRHLRNIADWSTPWRLMQRALRGVIIDRLECHSNQKVWIEKDLASKIRHRIIGAIYRQKSVIEVVETRIGSKSQLRSKIRNSEIDRLVEIACYRYHAAMKTEPISMILDGRISVWYTFSRLEKSKFDKFQLHLAPDLVWFRGNSCHLMRFTVQGVSNPGDDRMLENMAMVTWAEAKQGLPYKAERFVVENLYWSRGRWNLWSNRANSKLVLDSSKMILKDMNAMIELHDRLGTSCDLSQIPLAASKRTCRNCGHRDTCPGGEDLVRARLEQSALEMAKASK